VIGWLSRNQYGAVNVRAPQLNCLGAGGELELVTGQIIVIGHE